MAGLCRSRFYLRLCWRIRDSFGSDAVRNLHIVEHNYYKIGVYKKGSLCVRAQYAVLPAFIYGMDILVPSHPGRR